MNHVKDTGLILGGGWDNPYYTARQRAILREAYNGDDETLHIISWFLYVPFRADAFMFDVYELEALCRVSPSFGARYLAERWKDKGMTPEKANRIIDLGLDLFRLRKKDDRIPASTGQAG